MAVQLDRLDVGAHRRVVGEHAAVDHRCRWLPQQPSGPEVGRRGRGRTRDIANREIAVGSLACLVPGEKPGIAALQVDEPPPEMGSMDDTSPQRIDALKQIAATLITTERREDRHPLPVADDGSAGSDHGRAFRIALADMACARFLAPSFARAGQTTKRY